MNRFILPLLLTGALALPTMGLLASHYRFADPAAGPMSPPSSKTLALSADKAEAFQIANMLDGIVQPRFYDESGMFGMSRMEPLIRGHERASRLPLHARGAAGKPSVQTRASPRLGAYELTEHDMEVLKAIRAQNRDYQVGFLHTSHVPGQRPSPLSGRVPSSKGPQLALKVDPRLDTMYDSATNTATFFRGAAHKDSVYAAAIKALPELLQGKAAVGETEKAYVFLRPVTASKETCVKCHEGSKAGDCLGVMVYTVNKALKSVTTVSR